MHYCPMKVKGMSSLQYVKTGICEKYQTLLEESERALAAWNERRAKITQSRLVGKDAGDELLRLQAKYARAYTLLQNHSRSCTFCQLVKRLEGRESENSSAAVFNGNGARYR
jgi:hypothetical protein